MQPLRTLILIVTAASLVGCVSSDGIKSTAVIQPANQLAAGRDIATANVNSDAWPQSDWWTQLQDPQLNNLIARALADNPRLAVAASRIAEAEALAHYAHANSLPKVDAQAAAIHTHFSANHIFPAPLGGGDFWDNGAQLGLSYELDLWGRDEHLVAAGLAEVQVRRYEQQSAQLALAGAMVRSYAALELQFATRDIQQAILDDQQRILTIAQRRINAGIGTEFEAQEIIAEIAATKARLIQTETRMTLLRHTLGALTGTGPAAGDELQRPQLRFEQAVALPANLPADLLGRRPDVLAARWRVEQASDNAEVARANFYPNINLRAAVGMASLGFDKFLAGDSSSTTAGPAISLPIFDGGRLRTTLQARNAQYDAAVHSYNATLVDALTGVADQIANLDALQRIAQQRGDALAAAERAHNLAQKAFAGGLTDSLNVLHTETALNLQRHELADVRCQQIEAWAALNQALGGGMTLNENNAAQTAAH